MESENIYGLSKSFGIPASHIKDFVWIGNIYDAINQEFLDKNNIKIVMSVMGGLPQMFAGMVYVFYPLDQPFGNTKPLAEDAAMTLNRLTYTKNNILVNCLEGVDRSSTIVWRWLRYAFNFDSDTCVKIIKEKRPVANPHPDWFE